MKFNYMSVIAIAAGLLGSLLYISNANATAAMALAEELAAPIASLNIFSAEQASDIFALLLSLLGILCFIVLRRQANDA